MKDKIQNTKYKKRSQIEIAMPHVLGSMFRDQRGLTFVEMIVVIGIFSVLAGVSLFSFSSFTNNITLQNVAQDVSLRIVEAQRGATSGYVSQIDSLSSNANYRPSYGVYFNILGTGLDQFSLFIDLPISNDGRYAYEGQPNQNCPSGECRSVTKFQNGYGIKKICLNQGTICPSTPITKAYVRFERPYLDAKLYYVLSGGSSSINYSDMEIELYSPKGLSSTIIVRSTGQVEVQQGTIDQIF
jgi:prepilin-type N-terminal cleavage/methylation domain-containing protein